MNKENIVITEEPCDKGKIEKSVVKWKQYIYKHKQPVHKLKTYNNYKNIIF